MASIVSCQALPAARQRGRQRVEAHHEPPQDHLEPGLLHHQGEKPLAVTFQVQVRQDVKHLQSIES